MKSINIRKSVIFILVCILAFSTISTNPMSMADMAGKKKMRTVGYYTSWSAYNGFTPDKIDATKLTHINYAFANIDEELKVILGDSYIDPINIRKLNELKRTNSNLKTLISVGGWTWSDKFSDAALTQESRAVFADSAVEFIKKYNFDGIDLDWEFPVTGGLSTNVTRKEDKENFTLLLKSIRDRLDVQGKKDGKHYILTIAGAAGTMGVDNLELWNIHKYLDFANVMTYDMHGVWDKYTDFNAPLYVNEDSPNSVKPSVDKTVWSWVGAGFPKEKIVIGIPFLGKKYNNVNMSGNGLYEEFKGGSSISYDDIVSKYLNNSEFKRYFNWSAMSPWIYDGTTFISYEDQWSIAYKANYIKHNGLGGAMIWELSHDKNSVLLDKLYNGLQ